MIKLDNFVIQMVKGEGDEMKPGAVIRFNIGEGDKMKQFEHILSDEESQETLDLISFHTDFLIARGAGKNIDDFEKHIAELKEERDSINVHE